MKKLSVAQPMAEEQYFVLSITILHCDDFCIAVSKKIIKGRQNEKDVSGYTQKVKPSFSHDK